MHVTIFGKNNCAKCETTKNKLRHFLGKWELEHTVAVRFFDMDSVEGLTEGAYHDVVSVPTTIISDDQRVLARWNGDVPHSEQIKEVLLQSD